MRQDDGPIQLDSQQPEQNPKPPVSGRRNLWWLILGATVVLALCAFALQNSPALHAVGRSGSKSAAPKHQEHSSQTAEEYKPLMEELGRLQEKMAQGVQFPAPRTQSRLLPSLPSSTSFFAGLPNYGEALHQASQIFHQELQESSVLNDFWRNKVGMAAPIVDEVIDKTYQLLGFLGDEIVISGTVNTKGGSVLLMTEARKPGLRAFIQQLVGQYADKTRPPVYVYTPQQLALAKAQPSHKPFFLLVRSDFVIGATDLTALKNFNAQLNRNGAKFSSSPFGEKIAQQYQNGAGVVFAADLHELLSLRPHISDKDEALLQQSGFADLKYVVGEGHYSGGTASSTAELSFMGPRKGIAAWLGAPAPLTGLDFISPDAAYVVAFNLKSPSQVFDDIRNFALAANPTSDVGLAQLETELKIRLKEDLFSKLAGQLVIAVDGDVMPMPAWKVIAQLADANGMEHTLKQLIAVANAKQPEGVKVQQETDEGVSYYSLQFGSGPKPVEVECAFADGFLIVGGSRQTVKDAIRIRRNGNSLSRTSDFQDLLPRDQGNGASGIIYQNLGKVLGPIARMAPAEQGQILELMSHYSKPSATSLYGSEDAIRITGRSRGLDPSAALAVAAIAIPNLMRSKNAANQASAAATLRTLTMAESQYQITYAHYARDLATLGPNPGGSCEGNAPTKDHACLIDATLGCSGRWCYHDDFKFNITGVCNGRVCDDYVILATPTDANQGRKSFCSTSDGVVRGREGTPSPAPVSVSECQTWEPL
ncbi:MAG TPA: hypothetical protein VI685_07555 [Candidatus Angelobacter sp.]